MRFYCTKIGIIAITNLKVGLVHPNSYSILILSYDIVSDYAKIKK